MPTEPSSPPVPGVTVTTKGVEDDGPIGHVEVIDDGYDEAEEAEAVAMWDFVHASVAVWRQIDVASAQPEGYSPTWEKSQDGRALRLAEREAWERYRDFLPGDRP